MKPIMIDDTEVMVTKASMVGICRKCNEPTTGEFNSDEDGDEDSNYWVIMKCVNCGFKHNYIIHPEIAAFEYEE